MDSQPLLADTSVRKMRSEMNISYLSGRSCTEKSSGLMSLHAYVITVSSGPNFTSGSLSAKLHSSIYEASNRRDNVRGVDEAAMELCFRSSLRDDGPIPRGVAGRDVSVGEVGAVDENFLLTVCPVVSVPGKENDDILEEVIDEELD